MVGNSCHGLPAPCLPVLRVTAGSSQADEGKPRPSRHWEGRWSCKFFGITLSGLSCERFFPSSPFAVGASMHLSQVPGRAQSTWLSSLGCPALWLLSCEASRVGLGRKGGCTPQSPRYLQLHLPLPAAHPDTQAPLSHAGLGTSCRAVSRRRLLACNKVVSFVGNCFLGHNKGPRSQSWLLAGARPPPACSWPSGL